MITRLDLEKAQHKWEHIIHRWVRSLELILVSMHVRMNCNQTYHDR